MSPVRRALVCACVTAAGLLAPATAGSSSAGASAATLPPGLVALEQKTAELKVTSLLFSLHTSIRSATHDRLLRALLKQLGASTATGEMSLSPFGAIVSLQLAGESFKVRVLSDSVYVYLPGIAARDGGRPWVKVDAARLGQLLASEAAAHNGAGREAAPIVPGLAKPPFAQLQRTLAGAREVRELPPASIEGQPVSRFLAVLKPQQYREGALLAEPHPEPRSEPIARMDATASPARSSSSHRKSSSSATMEVSLTQTGLPLRTLVREREAGVSVTVRLDIPVINFPLVVAPPAARETITFAAFKALAQHRHK